MEALSPIIIQAWTRLTALLSYRGTEIVGSLLGRLSNLFGTRAAKVTRTNIKHCFPAMREVEVARLTTASLVSTGRIVAEAGMVFEWPAERIDTLIREAEGLSYLESSVAVKKGVLMLVPHFGNWELLGLVIGKYKFTALYDPPRVASLDPLIRKTRERTGNRLAAIDGPGLRTVYQALMKGRPVALLPDQVPSPSAGTYAPFFGRPTLTMTFAHRLIQSTRPLVVIGSCRRVDDGFKIVIAPVDEDVYAEDQLVSVTAMNRAIESLVREDPAQYQWEYKRFKRPPPGSAKLYND